MKKRGETPYCEPMKIGLCSELRFLCRITPVRFFSLFLLLFEGQNKRIKLKLLMNIRNNYRIEPKL